MLMPKRVKYRKAQRGRMRGKAQRGSTLAFGEYGLKALEPGWVTNRQIEAARVALTRSLKRGGKVWIRVFPDKPVTKKPAETRMGNGKGNPEEWAAADRGRGDHRGGRAHGGQEEGAGQAQGSVGRKDEDEDEGNGDGADSEQEEEGLKAWRSVSERHGKQWW